MFTYGYVAVSQNPCEDSERIQVKIFHWKKHAKWRLPECFRPNSFLSKMRERRERIENASGLLPVVNEADSSLAGMGLTIFVSVLFVVFCVFTIVD